MYYFEKNNNHICLIRFLSWPVRQGYQFLFLHHSQLPADQNPQLRLRKTIDHCIWYRIKKAHSPDPAKCPTVWWIVSATPTCFQYLGTLDPIKKNTAIGYWGTVPYIPAHCIPPAFKLVLLHSSYCTVLLFRYWLQPICIITFI